MRRMSVHRGFAYSYLVLYSVATVPGMLLLCVVLTVGAMWSFALFETLAFTAYFVVHMLARTDHPEQFPQSQAKLSLPIGILNSRVLLASSWSVARCVQNSRAGEHRSALTNALLTAIHALRLLIGFVVPGVVVRRLRGPEQRSHNLEESGGVYWHIPLRKRLLIAWVALSLMTLGCLAMDHSADRAGELRPSTAVTVGAVLIAAVWLGRLTDLWIIVLVGSLLGSCFIGRTVAQLRETDRGGPTRRVRRRPPGHGPCRATGRHPPVVAVLGTALARPTGGLDPRDRAAPGPARRPQGRSCTAGR